MANLEFCTSTAIILKALLVRSIQNTNRKSYLTNKVVPSAGANTTTGNAGNSVRNAALSIRPLHRARQLYKNISMLFLFPVKDGKLSTGVNATSDVTVGLQQSKITLQKIA